MKSNRFSRCCCLIILLEVSSCITSPPFNENEKIFHGAPESMGIGGLSFGLYKDHRYLIRNSGGLGAFEYSGLYTINGDTIVFNNLSKDVPVESNRLVIFRYEQQDSTYWEWKYSRIYNERKSDPKLGKWLWEQFKSGDSVLGQGDVYQLDKNNLPIKTAFHFLIRLDSLRNYR
jgi:hypothetical protein